MNDKPNWQVARLDDIERRGRDIPVREHLGIHAFGINAYTPSEDGTLINDHDEAGSGQEELYIVLDGKASEFRGQTQDIVLAYMSNDDEAMTSPMVDGRSNGGTGAST